MAKKSAGLLVYRYRVGALEFLLVHPGGPFWERRDEGAWSIPKGEYLEDESPLETAKREFFEETGFRAEGEFQELAPLTQPGGKRIMAWACAGEYDARLAVSNTFTMEWPPKSGRQAEFPEVDRAEWFTPEVARQKIIKGQQGFVDQLCALLGYRQEAS